MQRHEIRYETQTTLRISIVMAKRSALGTSRRIRTFFHLGSSIDQDSQAAQVGWLSQGGIAIYIP